MGMPFKYGTNFLFFQFLDVGFQNGDCFTCYEAVPESFICVSILCSIIVPFFVLKIQGPTVDSLFRTCQSRH